MNHLLLFWISWPHRVLWCVACVCSSSKGQMHWLTLSGVIVAGVLGDCTWSGGSSHLQGRVSSSLQRSNILLHCTEYVMFLPHLVSSMGSPMWLIHTPEEPGQTSARCEFHLQFVEQWGMVPSKFNLVQRKPAMLVAFLMMLHKRWL